MELFQNRLKSGNIHSSCWVLNSIPRTRVVWRHYNRMSTTLAEQNDDVFMMTSSNGTFSALLDICAGNSSVTGVFPTQRPVAHRFDVFFGLRLNIRFSTQWWGWWFETPSHPSWQHCNVLKENVWILTKVYYYSMNRLQDDAMLLWNGIVFRISGGFPSESDNNTELWCCLCYKHQQSDEQT